MFPPINNNISRTTGNSKNHANFLLNNIRNAGAYARMPEKKDPHKLSTDADTLILSPFFLNISANITKNPYICGLNNQ